MWQLRKGPAPLSFATGPSSDHTTSSANGFNHFFPFFSLKNPFNNLKLNSNKVITSTLKQHWRL
jgi:hypothetical protein